MNDNRQDNTLSIIAIVIGGLGFILSIIPCLFFISLPLGILGLILGVIAYFKARDNGDKKTLSIVALIVSFLPLLISGIYYITLSNFSNNVQSEYTYIQDCDSLRVKIEELETEVAAIEREMENEEGASKVFGNISKITSLSIKLGKMQNNAADIGCDIYNNGGVIIIDSLNSNQEVLEERVGE